MYSDALLLLEARKLMVIYHSGYWGPRSLSSDSNLFDLNSAILYSVYKKNLFGKQSTLEPFINKGISSEEVDKLLDQHTSLTNLQISMLRLLGNPTPKRIADLNSNYPGWGTKLNAFYQKAFNDKYRRIDAYYAGVLHTLASRFSIQGLEESVK